MQPQSPHITCRAQVWRRVAVDVNLPVAGRQRSEVARSAVVWIAVRPRQPVAALHLSGGALAGVGAMVTEFLNAVLTGISPLPLNTVDAPFDSLLPVYSEEGSASSEYVPRSEPLSTEARCKSSSTA